ncbi:MAG: hypothetical protein HKN13_09615, partial [Rhodothermales bacterium]|nr:hypothetical protein [Rhodothermales bacterium]
MRYEHPSNCRYAAGRKLLTLSATAFVLAAVIVLMGATPFEPHSGRSKLSFISVADTDSVVVNGIRVAVTDTVAIDSLRSDTLGVDSLAADSNRADRYIPLFRRRNRNASVADRLTSPIGGRLPNRWTKVVELDSLTGNYIARERVGDIDVRSPLSLDRPSYRSLILRRNLESN